MYNLIRSAAGPWRWILQGPLQKQHRVVACLCLGVLSVCAQAGASTQAKDNGDRGGGICGQCGGGDARLLGGAAYG